MTKTIGNRERGRGRREETRALGKNDNSDFQMKGEMEGERELYGDLLKIQVHGLLL